MLILDNRTLLVVIGIIATGAAITLAFLWRSQTQRNGVGYWAAGMSSIALASILVSLRDLVPDFVSLMVANLLYVVGFLFILRGIRVFSERPPLLFLDFSLIPIAGYLFYYFKYIEESQSIRIVVFSAVVVVVCTSIVVALLTDKNKAKRSAGLSVATIFGLFAFLNFMRGFMALMLPSQESVIQDSLTTTLLYLSGIFFVGGVAITLVLQTYSMLASKLRTVSLAVDQSASSIVITDNDGRIEYINPAALEKMGYQKEEVIGKHTSTFRANIPSPEEYAELSKQLNSGKAWRGQLLNRKKSGEEFWELVSIAPVKQTNGDISHFVAVKEDITALTEAKKKIQHLAHHDNLTGLPTRALMMERLESALLKAQSNHCQVAVLFIDIDGFKAVNDTFGHATGDELLKLISEKLCVCVRDTDTVARIGGDEFLIVLTHITDNHVITVITERMIQATSELFDVYDSRVNVSVSVGIAQYPIHSKDPHELIQLADQAMYGVKRAGKNNFAFAISSQEANHSIMNSEQAS
ncbi:sensor domain-containing diguanylate cyclase [Vibrio rumoiensis]|uniref:Regulator n=1 Tax=Vibrio rumoiensis 1S-45 TaxID=1188252 RepID=A0A1E5E5E0_9VIBR|nr:sensor domain-containing diguanylate cyclase [Vibrio rumoiensis]OEF28115.1 regulator [Vibrio rumoiensis 1S-45]